jgi:hypothetical protein
VPGRYRLGRFDDLLEHAHPVIDVFQLAVLHIQGVPAEPGPVTEQHTGRISGMDVDLDSNGVRTVADIGRYRFGHLSSTWIEHVLVPRLGYLRSLGTEDLHNTAVFQRQDVVSAGLDPPQIDEFLQLVRVLVGEIVTFARVGDGVEQFPRLACVVGPHIRGGRCQRRCLPALVPDRRGPAHRVELGHLAGPGVRIVERRCEADAFQRELRIPLQRLRRFDAEALVHSGHDVGRVRVLTTDTRIRDP